MHKRVISIVTLLIMMIITSIIVNSYSENVPDKEDETSQQNPSATQEKPDVGIEETALPEGKLLTLYQMDGSLMFSLQQFAQEYHLEWEYDETEGTIYIKGENLICTMLKDTPVISKNGIYLPNQIKPYIDTDLSVYLPVEMIESVFEMGYESKTEEKEVAVFASEIPDQQNDPNFKVFEQKFPQMTEEELIAYLSFLSPPLSGASISKYDSHLPGADRSYRNGTHEGIDWYDGVTGITVDKSTPVLSMAEGIVVRADHDYTELNQEDRGKILTITMNLGHTPEYILDELRGQSVWVQYPHGVLVRYAHLSVIEDSIVIGKTVKKGEVIGYVGNSGTSDGVKGNNQGLHLHSDILIYNHLFWEHLNSEQIRDVLESLFPSE